MALKSCENCAKQFEGDENQIFCSSVCKQQAYRKRKNEKAEELLQMKFSLQEYSKVLETVIGKSFKENLVLFCFMRKNLPKDISFENLLLYLEHNIEEFNFTLSHERGTQNLSYKTFHDKYVAGEICIVERYE